MDTMLNGGLFDRAIRGEMDGKSNGSVGSYIILFLLFGFFLSMV